MVSFLNKLFSSILFVVIICHIVVAQYPMHVDACGSDPGFCTQFCVASDFTRFNYGECTDPTTCTCYWVAQ